MTSGIARRRRAWAALAVVVPLVVAGLISTGGAATAGHEPNAHVLAYYQGKTP